MFVHKSVKSVKHSCILLCPQLTSLELQYVSPKLLMCRDLELAVPGTYDPNQPIIRIQSIAPSLQVITSKQRPRKLTIMGKSHIKNCSFAQAVNLVNTRGKENDQQKTQIQFYI